MRLRICDLLDALVASDASVISVVILAFFCLNPYILLSDIHSTFFNFSLLFCWDAGKASSTAECNIYFGLA